MVLQRKMNRARYSFAKKYDLRQKVYFAKLYHFLGAKTNSRNPNLVPIGEGFGFLLYFDYPNFNSKLEKQ